MEMFLQQLRVNSIVMVTAEGIVFCNKDSNLLAINGGPILITKYWGKSLMIRMNFEKRKTTTKAKISIGIILGSYWNHGIILDHTGSYLVINWDHTGIILESIMFLLVTGPWRWEGSKKAAIADIDDKRQITAVLSVIVSGHFLSPQNFPEAGM